MVAELFCMDRMSSGFHFNVAWLALMLDDVTPLVVSSLCLIPIHQTMDMIISAFYLFIDIFVLKSSSLLSFVLFVTAPPSTILAYIIPSMVRTYFIFPSFCRFLVSVSNFCDVGVRCSDRFGILFLFDRF